MTRTIRPIGPVTSALKRHGYRQQAVILVDGEQVPNLTVLSKKIGDKIRFVGHYIDDSGEIHVTKPMVDMKKAASRIMTIRQGVLDSTPAVAARKPTAQSIGAMIQCPGCGQRHSDDDMCPED
jgi:hypothetical protein